MAETMPPSHEPALGREYSPDNKPAVMDFTHTDTKRRKSGRTESDRTLCEENDSEKEDKVQKIQTEQDHEQREQVDPKPLQRAQTDIPPSTNHRPPTVTHQSTGFRWGYSKDESDGSEFDSSDGSDNEASNNMAHLKKSRTLPGNNTMAASDLRRPKRRHGFRSEKSSEGRIRVGNDFFRSRGKVGRDGRLNISVNETANTGYIAKALGATIQRHMSPQDHEEQRTAAQRKAEFGEAKDSIVIPRLNIVIMVIGSRGDIQPFLKIGKILRDKYNHRVRIASHPTFKKFVEELDLEFFSIGGDPSELMSFMVKNPGLIPSIETVKAGEIGRRRESMYEMFQGFWRACINTTDDERDVENLKMIGSRIPFVADCIIANPPSFAHYHCAERLGIPLHLVFTFPYTPTTSFPHPLTNIKASNVDQNYTNYMSYPLVDLMTWQGLGDLVNKFRVKTLGLEPVSTLWAPGQLSRLKVPMTYLWSPSLVPKPADWGSEIDIAGYVFLDLASSFKPPDDLNDFLNEDDDRPLIYVGFGSISGIDDPEAFAQMVFDGIGKANVRAVVNRGWGGMGDGMEKPDGVFLVDSIPHDWLFPKVDAVVHHGGAGTTAAGLKFGKPTMIVPFFGDQPFWSSMIARAGAGAKEALPLKQLDSDKFAEGIKQCLEPDAKAKAQEIAKRIEDEGDGAENAVDSFHRSLPLEGKHSLRCAMFADRVAAWRVKGTSMQLSTLAAELLVEQKKLRWSDMLLLRHYEWTDFRGPGEPLTGAGGVLFGTLAEAVEGVTTIPQNLENDVKKHSQAKRKKRRMTVADAIIMPGRYAHAIHGQTPVEARKREEDRYSGQVNLHGMAEPAIRPSLNMIHNENNHAAMEPLTRTRTDLSDPGPVAKVIVRDIGRGIGHSAWAVVNFPSNMVYASAQGFRNAPRLYGDPIVRPPPPTVKGFRSGVKTAGQELFFGFYDGVSGLVRIPYSEIRRDGMSGIPGGFARGVGGLFLKPMAGLLGTVAYTDRGIRQSLRGHFRDTDKTDRFLRRARMSQGAKEILTMEGADLPWKPANLNTKADNERETRENKEQEEEDKVKQGMKEDVENEKTGNKSHENTENQPNDAEPPDDQDDEQDDQISHNEPNEETNHKDERLTSSANNSSLSYNETIDQVRSQLMNHWTNREETIVEAARSRENSLRARSLSNPFRRDRADSNAKRGTKRSNDSTQPAQADEEVDVIDQAINEDEAEWEDETASAAGRGVREAARSNSVSDIHDAARNAEETSYAEHIGRVVSHGAHVGPGRTSSMLL